MMHGIEWNGPGHPLDDAPERDDGAPEDWARRAERRQCPVCYDRGGHADGCPEREEDSDE
jgi:hypothetical protein